VKAVLRVKLSCGHWFDIGSLSEAEEKTRSTNCPQCGFKIVGIVEARRLRHPPNSKKKWVEGEKVL
jgi:DNA-directed RNA polymerase subunit RPC12/RpoP